MKVEVGSWAWFNKEDLSASQIQRMKHDLTILPQKVGNYPTDEDEQKEIELFTETSTRFGVAREYFLPRKRVDHEIIDLTSQGDKSVFERYPLSFGGALREEQKTAIEKITTMFRTGTYGGILQASPGWGKTVGSSAIVAEMRTPTIVVVHKEFLMNQWVERLKQFLPGVRLGHVQQDVCDYKDKHVVLAMIHTLVARTYPEEFYRNFGLMIFDETHRVGSFTWSQVPPKFPCRYRLGVSATPRRKDGAENVFYYHLGPVIFKGSERRLTAKVRRVWTNFTVAQTPNFNPNLAPKALLVRFLCSSKVRNAQIIEQLIQALQAGRKVMVLSERLKHLDVLEKMLHSAWKPEYGKYPTTGKYVGGMTEEERSISAKKNVIFATSSFAAEGLDIPALDTLLLTTPMVDIEQAVGRICRPFEGKKDPIVVDFRDDRVKMFKKMGQSRDHQYKKIGC